MSILSLNGKDLKKFFRGCAEGIRENIDELNRIDKFPFADKDTGTNMYLTISGINEALMNDESLDIAYVASEASRAAVKRAKGNSGIILSHIIRGFEAAAGSCESMGAVEFAKCFHYATEFVSKNVLYKKGNTMCVLIKDITKKIMDTCLVTDDIGEILTAGVKEAEERILKNEEIDAGALGLFCFMRGGMKALRGNAEYAVDKSRFGYTVKITVSDADSVSKDDVEMLFYGIGKVSEFTSNEFTIMTNYPLKIVEKTKGFHIENLLIEKGKGEEILKRNYGFAVFSIEEGAENIYNKSGIDSVITGDSMEKGTEIIENINADFVFVMADSRENYKKALKCCENNENAVVIETKSLPEVIWAMTGFSETKTPEDNKYAMTDCVMSVMTGMVKEVSEANGNKEYSLIFEDRNVTSENSSPDAVKKLAEMMLNEKTSAGIIAVFYGEGVYENEINELTDFISKKYEDVDIEIYKGGQHKYRYIIGVV